MMVGEPRQFPPPWRAEKMPGGYVVRDANDAGCTCIMQGMGGQGGLC